MKCAALQWDVRRGAAEWNLAAAQAGLAEARGAGARLVVLPELWATSFPDADGRRDGELLATASAAADWARAASEEAGIVVAGSYLVAADGARFRNRLLVFDGGRELLAYDKLHLFRPSAEHEAFEAGDVLPPVVESSLGRMSGAICYDLRFGELFTHMLSGGVEVVVCPAQWPVPRAAHWRALVMGRAVELQALVVAANRLGDEDLGGGRVLSFGGNSLLADGYGEVLGEGSGEAGCVPGEWDEAAAKRLRIRVPVRKDRRCDVYGGEDAMGEAGPRPSDRRPRSDQ